MDRQAFRGRPWRRCGFVAFSVLLLLAGCAADSGTGRSDSDRNGGFYGGMTGGGVHP